MVLPKRSPVSKGSDFECQPGRQGSPLSWWGSAGSLDIWSPGNSLKYPETQSCHKSPVNLRPFIEGQEGTPISGKQSCCSLYSEMGATRSPTLLEEVHPIHPVHPVLNWAQYLTDFILVYVPVTENQLADLLTEFFVKRVVPKSPGLFLF